MALNSLDEEGVVSAAIACCKEAGSPQVEHHGADMADRGQIKDLFSFIRGKFGRTPDILVNNAGKSQQSMFLDSLRGLAADNTNNVGTYNPPIS